jgi:hypothetical protein
MTSLSDMLWGCIGYLDILEYKEKKLPTSLQQTVLFRSLLELSQLSKLLGRVQGGGLDFIWLTSIGHGGEFLTIPNTAHKYL